MELTGVIAENLKRFRAARNLTQGALAKRVGISLQTVWSYENGVHLPQIQTLVDIAQVLHVRPWQLLAAEGEGGAVPPELVDAIAAAARACGLKVGSSK